MLAQVIILRRLPRKLTTLDYAVPQNLQKEISVGQLVEVPFRTILAFGIVKNINAEVALDKKIKPIARLGLVAPFVNPAGLIFFEELSARYHAPLGWLIKNALPALLPKTFKLLEKTSSTLPMGPEQLALSLEKAARPRLHIYRAALEKKKILLTLTKNKGQLLVLVPEVIDMAATVKLFPKTLRLRTRLLTGATTAPAQRGLWHEVWSGRPLIIVGTRRALSLPFTALRRVIMLDEGNPVYKSWDMAPRFETRDAAELLARVHGAEFHLVTHTPSVEAWGAARVNTYASGINKTLGRFPARIINMLDERKGGNQGSVSEELFEAIKDNNSGVTFLHVARRGDAQYIACRDCGYVWKCPNCKTTLTAWDARRELKCRHCSYRQTEPTLCPTCGGASLVRRGPGAEVIARELRRELPTERPILVWEKDAARDFPAKLLPGAIVLGTTFALQKIDPQKITLLAFMDADSALFVPEYQAAGELWFMLRAGAVKTKTVPIIQTAHPEHPLFKALAQPINFYTDELAARQMFNYPPYCLLLKIWAGFPSSNIAENATTALVQTLKALTASPEKVTILGPTSLFPSILRGEHWCGIIIKIKGNAPSETLKKILSAVPDNWKVDVAPRSLLSHN